MDSKEQFQEVLAARIKKMKDVLDAKEKEYSSAKDRYYNFQRAAEIIGKEIGRVSEESALLGMLVKHLVCVIDMLKYPYLDYSEAYIDEKFGDSVNYLTLGEGMLKARIKKTVGGQSMQYALAFCQKFSGLKKEEATEQPIFWTTSGRTHLALVACPRSEIIARITPNGAGGFEADYMGVACMTGISTLEIAKEWITDLHRLRTGVGHAR